LTAQQIDLSGRVVVFESLKKRRRGVYRAVPVPPELLDALDLVHGIRAARAGNRQKPWLKRTVEKRSGISPPDLAAILLLIHRR
jgi:integrase/recombinase XerD